MLLTAVLAAAGGTGAYTAGAAYVDRPDTRVVRAVPSPATATPSPTPSATPLPARLSEQALAVAARATVLLTPPDDAYSGSGTIVSADGLVLTNAHVAAPQAPGHAVRRNDPEPSRYDDPAHLVVSVTDGDSAARATYRASVLAVDGYLDLAVLRIDGQADGSPLPAGLRLPVLPLGSVADVEKNDRLTALGFPGLTGGQRLDVTEGSIRNLLPDEQERVPGERYTVATTLDTAPGNSGGAAVDNAGRLVAVPSSRLSQEGTPVTVGQMRPVDLARPLLDAARAGRPYVSPWFTAGTGVEDARDLGWTEDPVAACEQEGRGELSADGTAVTAQVVLEGLAREEDLLLRVSRYGEPVLQQLRRWSGEPCLTVTVAAADVDADVLSEGELVLEVFAGPRLEPLLTSTLELVITDL